MAYKKFTDKEINALENLTLREVSRAYYEANKMKVSPVIRNRHILMFRCDKCGRCFQYREGVKPQAYEEYKSRKYCRECWKKEQELIRVPCCDCGRPITLFESRNQFKGRCRECWLKMLPSLRKKYGRYRSLLEDILLEKGIKLEPMFTDGLDETGRPDHCVEDLRLRVRPLRDNEYALYLFYAGNGVLAFPDNGIGLRYIKAPSSEIILEAADVSESLLAGGSDGKDIYVLTGKGELYSSNENILKGENPGCYGERIDRLLGKERRSNLKPVQIIDPKLFCLRKAGEYFTEEQIMTAAAKFSSQGIAAVNSNTYYDPEAKKFFKVLTDGNYYHGYDVFHEQVSRSKIMDDYVRRFFSIDQFIDQCEAGTIPMLVIISKLPWVEGPYDPPETF